MKHFELYATDHHTHTDTPPEKETSGKPHGHTHTQNHSHEGVSGDMRARSIHMRAFLVTGGLSHQGNHTHTHTTRKGDIWETTHTYLTVGKII